MNLVTFIKKNNVKNIQDLQKTLTNKQIKIVGKTSGHAYPFGNWTVSAITGGATTGTNPYFACKLLEHPNLGAYNLYVADIEIMSFSTISDFETEIKELKKDITDKEKLIAKYNQRISFMEKNNIDEFSEEDYKILNALTYIEDNTLNKVEKARVIGKMLKGEEVL